MCPEDPSLLCAWPLALHLEVLLCGSHSVALGSAGSPAVRQVCVGGSDLCVASPRGCGVGGGLVAFNPDKVPYWHLSLPVTSRGRAPEV